MVLFLRLWVRYWDFGQRFEIKSPKLPHMSNFILIDRQTAKTWSHFSWCRDTSKMTIMTSYHQIEDDIIKILAIWKDLYPSYIPTKFHHHLTWNNSLSEDSPKKTCHFDNTSFNCLKCDTSLAKISWTIFEMFSNWLQFKTLVFISPPPPHASQVY